MEKRTVKLNSRYHCRNTLTQLEDHKWVLKCEDGSIRLGLDNEDHTKYVFIDPAGGPFMSIHYPIDEINETLESIEWVDNVGYVLTTK